MIRRFAIHIILIILIITTQSQSAWTQGSPSIPEFISRSQVVGFSSNDFPFKNYLKMAVGWGGSGDVENGSNLTADQYPNGVLPSGFNTAAEIPASYTGTYTMVWTGTLAVSLNGQAATIYSGGPSHVAGCKGSPCYINNNTFVFGTDGSITFDLSLHVINAVNNGSGLCKLTLSTTGFLSNGSLVNVKNIGGVTGCSGRFAVANLVAGAGSATGTMDLAGSAFSGAFTSGGQVFPYDPNGNGASINLWAQGQKWSNVTNVAICRTADFNNDRAGCIGWVSSGCQAASAPRRDCSFNDDFLSALKTANYGAIRFLDAVTHVFSIAADYAHWPQTTNFTYKNLNWLPSLWAGSLIGTDSYTVTCFGTCGFTLMDGAVVQAQVANTNLTYTPTLNVNGTGAFPILNINGVLDTLRFGGTYNANDVLTVTFTPSNSKCFGGSPHAVSYTVKSDDNSAAASRGLQAKLNADGALTALPVGLLASNPNNNGTLNLLYANNNGCGIAITTSVTGSGGTETLNVGGEVPDSLAAGHNYTFVFNSTLKAYITNGKGAGVGQSWPWPVQLALCRAVNAACWLELPLLWSTSSVASWSADIATNACRTCGGILTEISNEVWNFGNYQTTQAYSLGYSLGFVKGSFASYYGLRMAQFWPIITSAWGGGNGLHLMNAFDCCDGGTASSILAYRVVGTELCGASCGNSAYQNAIGIDYNTAPNRPRDLINTESFAEYIGNILSGPDTGGYGGSYASFSCTYSAISGNVLTVSGSCAGKVLINEGIAGCDGTYITSKGTGTGGAGTYNLNSTTCSIVSSTITGGEVLGLQYAADNYNRRNGALGSQADGLNWADDDLRAGTRNGSLGAFTLKGYVVNAFSTKGNIGGLNYPLIEYEGGIDALAPTTSQAVGIGLPSAAYGGAGGYVDNLISGYKNSALFKQFTLDGMNAVASNMPAHSQASKFNFEGGNAPWGIYPADLYSTPYQDYNAACAFNGSAC
jgi:hypothetical protein